MPSILTLIYDLTEAVALTDAECTFLAINALAERIGREAAVAVAQALADEASPLSVILDQPLADEECPLAPEFELSIRVLCA